MQDSFLTYSKITRLSIFFVFLNWDSLYHSRPSEQRSSDERCKVHYREMTFSDPHSLTVKLTVKCECFVSKQTELKLCMGTVMVTREELDLKTLC